MNYNLNIDPGLLHWVVIPGFIFVARILDVTFQTIRIMFVARGMKLLAPALGFLEVFIWLLAIGLIMQNLTNPLNYIAYCAGFATGNFFGIVIENRIAMGVNMIRVITKKEASELVEHLRKTGLSVTSIDAEGNSGPVKVFFTVVKRKNIKNVVNTILVFNPNAFYTIEEIGSVHQAIVSTSRQKRQWLEWFGLKRK